jgi:type II secretory pathway component PulJ
MSLQGIKQFANLLRTMQTVRNELLRMGCAEKRTDKQDIRLARLVSDADECVKGRFTAETLKIEHD